MLLGLVEHVDVLLESFAPGLPGPARPRARPCCRRAIRSLVVSSLTALRRRTGRARPTWPPTWWPSPWAGSCSSRATRRSPRCGRPRRRPIYYGSVFAAYGVLLALFRRGEDGPGQAHRRLDAGEHRHPGAHDPGGGLRRRRDHPQRQPAQAHRAGQHLPLHRRPRVPVHPERPRLGPPARPVARPPRRARRARAEATGQPAGPDRR